MPVLLSSRANHASTEIGVDHVLCERRRSTVGAWLAREEAGTNSTYSEDVPVTAPAFATNGVIHLKPATIPLARQSPALNQTERDDMAGRYKYLLTI